MTEHAFIAKPIVRTGSSDKALTGVFGGFVGDPCACIAN